MEEMRELSNEELIGRAEAFARVERSATADLIACLAEVERREILLDRGYRHLFDFCVRRLRMSEGAAARRTAAVRAVRKRPEVLSHLQDGTLSLSAVCVIEPFLQEAEGVAYLDRAAGLGRRQLEEFAAELSQRKKVEEVVAAQAEPEPQEAFCFAGTTPDAHSVAPAPMRDRIVVPVPGRLRFSFEGTPRLREKLERVGTLLAGRLKSRRLEELVEVLVDLAIGRLDPVKRAARRVKRVGSVTRRVPWSVRRMVWERDGARCAYRAEDGTRCSSTRPLQYDHIRPWALGGRSDDPGNIRLLCRAHNLHLARKLFPAARRAAESARQPASSVRQASRISRPLSTS